MLDLSRVKKMAKENKARIGIGEGGGVAVKSSVKKAKAQGYGDVSVYSDEASLISALIEGEIDAAVRGSLEAKPVLNTLKSKLEVKSIMRIALLDTKGGELVLLAPVGVDEGQSKKEKLKIIIQGQKLLSKFNMKARVGVLSGGRLEDMGRHMRVDETLSEGEALTKQAIKKGISATHFGILLEDALESSNFVIAPDGITGNMIFRALHFFGGAKAIGAPVVNIDYVFVDTSRAKKDFSDSIALAAALCGV
jgi:putative methanogen marker protein 4